VALVLIGLLLAAVSMIMVRHARASDYFLNYRRAQLAATSLIERMRAGLAEVSDESFADGAGVSYVVRVTEPAQAWRPLQRVEVTARVVGKHSRIAQYRVATYMAVPPTTQGGAP